MLKKITESTVADGLGIPTGTKIFKVVSGMYAGRMIALVQTSTNDIKFAWADNPYTSWSSLTTIASDSSGDPCDAVMDSSGNLYVAYSEQTTRYLVCRKLTFSGGYWSVGSKVYIYNGVDSYRPALAIETGGKLWVSFSYLTNSMDDVAIKSSTDSGATWGTGPSDLGDTPTSLDVIIFSKIIIGGGKAHCLWVKDNSLIQYSYYPLEGGSWSSEQIIRGGSAISNDFDLAATKTGQPGVLFFETGLHYLEFDGSNWNQEVTIDSGACSFPQLRFENGDPAAVYLLETATGQIQAMYSTRKTGVFSTPAVIDDRMTTFDKVLLYDATSLSYNDTTTAASNTTPGDVSHPSSSCALKNIGDKMYLGMNRAFRFMRVLLSTTGVGGAVSFSYFDGANWVAFAPASGSYNFDSADHELLLWTDYNTIPEDWQKAVVNGSSNFWIKVEVTTDFSTGPVGTQLTSISDLRALCLRR